MHIKHIICQNVNNIIVNLECPFCSCNADRFVKSVKDEHIKDIKCPNCGKTEKDK